MYPKIVLNLVCLDGIRAANVGLDGGLIVVMRAAVIVGGHWPELVALEERGLELLDAANLNGQCQCEGVPVCIHAAALVAESSAFGRMMPCPDGRLTPPQFAQHSRWKNSVGCQLMDQAHE